MRPMQLPVFSSARCPYSVKNLSPVIGQRTDAAGGFDAAAVRFHQPAIERNVVNSRAAGVEAGGGFDEVGAAHLIPQPSSRCVRATFSAIPPWRLR